MPSEEHHAIYRPSLVVAHQRHLLAVLEPESLDSLAPEFEKDGRDILFAGASYRRMLAPTRQGRIESRSFQIELELAIADEVHGREVDGQIDFGELGNLLNHRERQKR